MDTKNVNRHFMVASFYCSQCGQALCLSYDKPAPRDRTGYSDGITGAYKVDYPVYISPCNTCYREVSEPLRKLKELWDKQEKKAEEV